jgi:hypothetical protein
VKTEYPKLHARAVKFLLCLSTTYLREAAFSAVILPNTNQSNRLQLTNYLRLAVTQLQPRVDKLVKEKDQQKSHQLPMRKTVCFIFP